jgi:hypothetical protein
MARTSISGRIDGSTQWGRILLGPLSLPTLIWKKSQTLSIPPVTIGIARLYLKFSFLWKLIELTKSPFQVLWKMT